MFYRTITFFVIVLISITGVYAVSTLTDTQVEDRIEEVQGTVPSGTPAAPTGLDQKGYIGSIIANIFDATQKIKTSFISAFDSILGVAFEDNIPKWNGQSFVPGTMNDVGGNIGIGITSPEDMLEVRSNIRLRGTQSKLRFHETDSNIDENYQMMMSNGRLLFQTNNDAFNSSNTIMSMLQNGNIGIGVSSPSTALHVNGNIIADDPIANNHVATKAYVDSVGGGGGSGSGATAGRVVNLFAGSHGSTGLVALSENINNFDAIHVRCNFSAGSSDNRVFHILDVKTLNTAKSIRCDSDTIEIRNGGDSIYYYRSQSNNRLEGIVGIDFGSGGGGGGVGAGTMSVTNLIVPNYTLGYNTYSGPVDVSGYDAIEFGGFDSYSGRQWMSGGGGTASTIVMVQPNAKGAINCGSNNEDCGLGANIDASERLTFQFFGGSGGDPRIAFVRGITFGSSGGGGGSADNLGNHIATQNLQLGGNDIGMGGGSIFGLPNPTSNGQVTPKSYVDSEINSNKLSCRWVTWGGGNGNGRFELRSGDPNTGNLNFSGNRRYMVEAGSVGQRCRQLGYTFGVATQQFSGWCGYSNARTAYFHQAASNGTITGWRSEGCSNKSVAAALCCTR